MGLTILTPNSTSVRPGLSSWQTEIRQAVRTADELCRRLDLPSKLAAAASSGAGEFPVFVPPSFLSRIRPGDPSDPLLRQVLPVEAESQVTAGYSIDPVNDAAAKIESGILQKYAGRALLITTGACAIHCRYCFRRHYPYEEVPHSEAAWDQALSSIGADATIHEVILSGGDPLMLVDERLARLTRKIAGIPHVVRLRIHTRLPIMVPTRVNEAMVHWLTGSAWKPIVVIHANHAQELDVEVERALSRLQRAGVLLLNQAVLLRGVNDSVQAQVELYERLIAMGVTPYYLHQLDRVAGAAQFEVPIDEGKQLIAELRRQLPGYAIPRYVQELADQPSKVVLA